MGVSLQVDLSGISKIQQLIANMQRKFSPAKPLLLAIAAQLRATTQDRFTTKKTPDGKAWTSSLVKSGDLRKKIDIAANNDMARVGSNLEYAAIHQLGGVIKPKKAKVLAFTIGGQKVFSKKVKINANPYLGISESDEAAIYEIVKDFYEESVK